MLQSSSPVFFSSFDNRDHSDAFLFFFSVKKGNKKMENAHAHQQMTACYDCELFEEKAESIWHIAGILKTESHHFEQW